MSQADIDARHIAESSVAYRAFRSLEQLTAQALSENPTPALGSAVPTSAVSLRGVRATPMVIYTVYVYFESPLNFGTARLLAKTSIMRSLPAEALAGWSEVALRSGRGGRRAARRPRGRGGEREKPSIS